MASDQGHRRLAVLIDAENTSAKIVEELFEEIAKLGVASVRRIYGDFTHERSKSWTSVLSKYGLIPQQQFAYTTGKNASDITLVIDAMDLLHTGRFSGFCLVSSDSDFTRLASRMREAGVDVYGFGEQKTPESLRQACDRFIYTENLVKPPIKAQAPVEIIEQSPAGEANGQALGRARQLIVPAIEEISGEGGWVTLAHLGSHLQKLSSDFDTRNFGFKKLSDLLRQFWGLELKDVGGGQFIVRVNASGGNTGVNQPQAAKPKANKAKSTLADAPL